MCLRLRLAGVVEVGVVGDRACFWKAVGEENGVRSWAGGNEMCAGHASESVGDSGIVDGSRVSLCM